MKVLQPSTLLAAAGAGALVCLPGSAQHQVYFGPVALAIVAGAQIEEAELTANGAEDGDLFGYSVAIERTRALVGAPTDESGGIEVGSATLFERTSGVWSQIAGLRASDGADGDLFGSAVSLSGTRALVGAYRHAEVGPVSGAAYVFEEVAGVWIETSKLVPSDAADYDAFGHSVALHGNTALVGARFKDAVASDSGAVYVFERQGSTWLETARLSPNDAGASQYFGESVSLVADRALIGATGANGLVSNTGAAYVFERRAGVWVETAKLAASDGAYSDYFGISVSLSRRRALVGQQAGDVGNFSGSAYVFDLVSGTWTETIKLVPSDPQLFDLFGCSVSIAGDLALVGAPQHDETGPFSGVAYLFVRTASGWKEHAQVTAGDTVAGDLFGHSVSLSPGRALVGALGGGVSAASSGSAYPFRLPVSSGEPAPKFILQWGSNGTANGQFSGPHGIEVDADGNVYVVDTGNNRVQKFTSDGVFLIKWGSPGAAPGQFNHPHGIGIGPMGDVYVAETGNNRVQRFTSQGVFLTTWGSFGNGNGQFRHNHGLAVDDGGNVFVVDRDQNRVQKFTSNGGFITTWGTPGTGNGEFTSPNGVAVDAQGNVFVADSSPRIQMFTNDGVFISSWGSAGVGKGRFNFPRGLSTDRQGNVYVADRNNHRMQKFTGVGAFRSTWGSFGTGAGQFNLPYAVRADGKRFVYVADSSNHRVQKFRIPKLRVRQSIDGSVTLPARR